MTRASKNSPRNRDLELVDTRQIRVPIAPPSCEEPEGIVSRYRYYQGNELRRQYYRQPPATQPLLVEYTVFKDTWILERIAARSLENRSGNSVRGPVRAEHGRIVDLGLSPSYLASKARRAANTSNHRTTDGPIQVRVKLLEQPVPVPAMCQVCKQPAMAHIREDRPSQGAYVGEGNERRYDHTAPSTETLWWCPS